MSKPELIKSSGWFFIAGACAFITLLTGSDPIAIPGSMVSAILLAVGMLRLRAACGERAGSFGGNMLLLGVLGPISLIIIIAMGLSGILTVTQIEEGLWALLFLGPAISLLGLFLFGMVALRSKPMPRWNWLPGFAGIWYPVLYFFAAGYLFTHHGVYPLDVAIQILQIIVLIQFLALCALGAALVSDTSEQMATA
jgi:hypothetical protein